MRYYYRFREMPEHEPYEYLTMEQIAKIPLYPATPELDREFETNEMSDLWPVHDIDKWSWEATDYDTEDAARVDLGISENMSVYEYIHDI